MGSANLAPRVMPAIDTFAVCPAFASNSLYIFLPLELPQYCETLKVVDAYKPWFPDVCPPQLD